MGSKDYKVISLFFAGGFTSGLLTMLLSYFTPWVVWAGVGIFFLLGLATSFILARRQGWLSLKAPGKRYCIAALIIVAAYPIAFSVLFVVVELYHSLYQVLFQSQWQNRTTSPEVEGFYIGLFLAAGLSALLVSLALKLITQKWDRKALVLMVVAGAMTIPLSIIIVLVIRFLKGYVDNGFFVLFIAGDAIFGALSGYWLLRANKSNEQFAVTSEPVNGPII